MQPENPPSYSAAGTLDPVMQATQREKTRILAVLKKGKVPELIKLAHTLTDDTFTGVRKNPLEGLGVLSCAPAFENDGSASWEIAQVLRKITPDTNNDIKQRYTATAARMKNKDALAFIDECTGQYVRRAYDVTIACTDDTASDFANFIKNRDQCEPEKLYRYALYLAQGTEISEPQLVRALGIAVLLKATYPEENYGIRLLMYFANTSVQIGSNGVNLAIFYPDLELARKYAQTLCNLQPTNGGHLTWLASFNRQLRNLPEAEKAIAQAMALQPVAAWTEEEHQKIQEALAAQTKNDLNNASCTIL
jgi:hypothetical protein